MSKFSDRLKELRINSGKTLREVSAALNVSHVSYLRWEQGKTQPSIESISKLCEIFDVSADYLLGIED